MGAPLFSFVHSPFFSESQINSASDARRLPARGKSENSGLAGSADGRARLSADNRLSSAASATWGSCPFGDSYVRAKPCQGGILSCVPGPRWCRRECTELGPSWLRPRVPTPFLGLLACPGTCIGSHPWKRDCEPGASMVTSLDTQGGVDIRL